MEDTDAETVKGVVAGLQMMGFTAKTELHIAEQIDSAEKAASDEAPEEGSVDLYQRKVAQSINSLPSSVPYTRSSLNAASNNSSYFPYETISRFSNWSAWSI